MIAFGLAVLLAGFVQPLFLLVLSAALNAVVMFLYSALLLWLNWRSFSPPLRPTRAARARADRVDRILRLLQRAHARRSPRLVGQFRAEVALAGRRIRRSGVGSEACSTDADF